MYYIIYINILVYKYIIYNDLHFFKEISSLGELIMTRWKLTDRSMEKRDVSNKSNILK